MFKNTCKLLAIAGLLGGSGMLWFRPVHALPGDRGPGIPSKLYSGDPSCNQLMSELRGMSNIDAQHVTNYQKQDKAWGGYATSRLSRGSFSDGSLLDGTGRRWYSDRTIDAGNGEPQQFDVKRPDSLSYQINTLRGTVTYNAV